MASSSFSSLSFQVLFRFSHALFICRTQDCPQNLLGSSTWALACSYLILSEWGTAAFPTSSMLFFTSGFSVSPQAKIKSVPRSRMNSSSSCKPSVSSLIVCKQHNGERKMFIIKCSSKNSPQTGGLKRRESFLCWMCPASWPAAHSQTPGLHYKASSWVPCSPALPPPTFLLPPLARVAAQLFAGFGGTKRRNSVFSLTWAWTASLEMLFTRDVLFTGMFCQYRN